VDVILGVNGYIWVCLGSADKTTEGNANSDGFENELVYSDKNDVSLWITHFPLMMY
jgi:exosome complex RNA-binding protein Rrp4